MILNSGRKIDVIGLRTKRHIDSKKEGHNLARPLDASAIALSVADTIGATKTAAAAAANTSMADAAGLVMVRCPLLMVEQA